MINQINAVDYNNGAEKDNSKIIKAAQSFEAIFIRQILNAQGNPDDTNAMSTIRNMQNASMADQMASGRGLGISQVLIEEWTKKP